MPSSAPLICSPSPLLTHLLKKPDLLTTKQAADYLGVTPRTLEVWRCTKRHDIPYIKVGRLVKYSREALDAWLTTRTVGSLFTGEVV